LLSRLDGRTHQAVRWHCSSSRFAILSARRLPMTLRQQFLSRIVQPDAFFILLIVGVLGLYTEFTHPGMVAPG